jgi:hypothetical protein
MGTLSILFGAILLGCGLMLFLMAIPLLRGSVGRNNYYSFRYARAYASDDAWRRINRYGARQRMIWSLPIIAAGLRAFWLSLDEQPFLLYPPLVVILICILIVTIRSYRFARRA